MFVARQVFIERLSRGHAGLLEFNDNKRQAVDEANQIRATSIEIARDRHLAHEQKVVRLWPVPIDHSHSLRLQAAALPIRNRDSNAIPQRIPNLPVRPSETHRRPVARKFIDSGIDRVGRQLRIQPFQCRAKFWNKNDFRFRLASQPTPSPTGKGLG
jgi:hypothetical protein